jgi:peptidoglycan/LPS O-acetylase OafA/YrhL
MANDRFIALDSCRGIAACMVAMFHVRAYSYVGDIAVLQNAFLFVDLFFVLSGFVLAAAYEERLAQGFGVLRFMVLRFGRVYPLHLALLLVFVATHLAQSGSFGAPEYSLEALAGNLLLVHSLGLFSVPTWNMPSWSISTEFFAYLVFALAASTLGRRLSVRLLLCVAAACALALLSLKGHINATHDFGVLRCLYGFSFGVLAWRLQQRREGDAGGTGAEVLAGGGALVFVALAGESSFSLLAPPVFALVVVVFARERGAVSAALRTRAFVWLGTLSYSIYMTHFFIARRMAELLSYAREAGIPGTGLLGVEKWAGDVLVFLYLLLVIGLSAVTYRLLEAPAREWFRRRTLAREPRSTSGPKALRDSGAAAS